MFTKLSIMASKNKLVTQSWLMSSKESTFWSRSRWGRKYAWDDAMTFSMIIRKANSAIESRNIWEFHFVLVTRSLHKMDVHSVSCKKPHRKVLKTWTNTLVYLFLCLAKLIKINFIILVRIFNWKLMKQCLHTNNGCVKCHNKKKHKLFPIVGLFIKESSIYAIVMREH